MSLPGVRQRDLGRQPREGTSPVVEPSPGVVRPGPSPQPLGVVGVLHGKRFPLWGDPEFTGSIGTPQVPGQRSDGPPIGGYVVQHQRQQVAGPATHDGGAQRNLAAQVEGFAGDPDENLVDLISVIGLPHVQRHRGPCRQNPLIRCAVNVREDRAQALVTSDQIVERRLQGALVEATRDLQHDGHVVDGGLVEAAEEPHPPLRGGHGHVAVSLARHQVGFRRHIYDRTLQQTERGRHLEHVTQRDGTTDHLLPAADQPDREQRVPTKLEEPLIHIDLVQAEYLGETAAGRLLPWRGGSPSRARILDGGHR